MLALLAPVPAKILADGFDVANPSGLVAFGTGELGEDKSGAWSFEFFLKEEFAAIRILHYVRSPLLKGILGG